jgi:transcriptional regulator with XRE-family HTH domain
LGLSQTVLGKAAGVTFQQIQKYEKGSNRISASNLHKVAEALQVRPEFFFCGLDPVLGKSPAEPATELSSQPDALALVSAFQRISNGRLRRIILRLIEDLSAIDVDGHMSNKIFEYWVARIERARRANWAWAGSFRWSLAEPYLAVRASGVHKIKRSCRAHVPAKKKLDPFGSSSSHIVCSVSDYCITLMM